MSLWSLEQGKASAHADLAFYAAVVLALMALLWRIQPAGQLGSALAWIAFGVVLWSLAEYGLHRWVLHGLQPFKRWHALHHARPRAWIATPTAMTAALFVAAVAIPTWCLLPPAQACALLLGVQMGYLGYISAHHAVHHGRGRHPWLRHLKRWHARHHGADAAGCYGVSLPLWDHLFGSAVPMVRQRTDAAPIKAYNQVLCSPAIAHSALAASDRPIPTGVHTVNTRFAERPLCMRLMPERLPASDCVASHRRVTGVGPVLGACPSVGAAGTVEEPA